MRPLGSVALTSAGAALSSAATAAASQRLAASNRAVFDGFMGVIVPQNLNAGPENRAGVAAMRPTSRYAFAYLLARQAQRIGRRLTGEDIIGASARLSALITITLVPTFTRLARSVTSSLVRRMQPDDTRWPMVEGALVPWMR